MKSIREILISALALTLIAGGVTAALAGTNALTKGPIRENTEKAEAEARQSVIPDKDAVVDGNPKTLQVGEEEINYYIATKDGETVGYIFTANSVGKSSGLVVMTGVDTTGKVCGVKIVEQNETAGYVKKVEKDKNVKVDDDKFFNRIKVTVEKLDSVEPVSGATKTSNGIKKAVKQALEWYELIPKGASANE